MRNFLISDHLVMVQRQYDDGTLADLLPANIGYYIRMSRLQRKQIAETNNLVGAWWIRMKRKPISTRDTTPK